jgi:Mg-chelatase subunit ChlD
VCFGGEEEVDWYRNIKNTKGLEELVTDKGPEGACLMGAAMDEVINDAFDKDLTNRPVSILVLTAGRPNDADELDETLKKTVNRLAESCDRCPLLVIIARRQNI